MLRSEIKAILLIMLAPPPFAQQFQKRGHRYLRIEGENPSISFPLAPDARDSTRNRPICRSKVNSPLS